MSTLEPISAFEEFESDGLEPFTDDTEDESSLPGGLEVELIEPSFESGEAEHFSAFSSFEPTAFESEIPGIDEAPDLPPDLPTSVEPEVFSSEALNAGYDADEVDEGEVDEDEVAIDPRTVRTRVGLAQSPFSKMVLVGVTGLVLLGGVGLFVSGLQNNEEAESSVVVDASPDPSTPVQGEEGDGDVGAYKSQLAFADQTEANAAFRRGQAPTPATANSTPSPTPTVAAVPPPTVRPASVAPVPLSPPPRPVSLPMTAQVQPLIQMEPELVEPISPVSQWQQAATMGSFGQTNATPRSGGSYPTAPTIAPVSAPTLAALPAMPVIPTSVAPMPVAPVGNSGVLAISQLRSSSSVPGLRDAPLASVMVGTTSEGRLQTAIVLAGDNSTASSADDPSAPKYLIQLSTSILDANDAVAIPAGAVIVAVVSGFSPDSGTLQLQARSLILDDREYQLPTGALSIRSRNGGTLTADRHGGGSGGLLSAALPALFAGVSQGAQQLNTPRSSTVTTAGGSTTSSTDSNPSVGAGFVEGVFGSLTQQLSQQAQNANQQAASSPVIWELSAGESVQVFVNSTFQM